jgi:hypothetical protein
MKPTSNFILTAATILLLPMANHAQGDSFVLTVPATANVFSAGLDAPIAPGGGGAGILPIFIPLSPGQNSFQLTASGEVSQFYGDFFHGPDGLPGYAANITAYGGVSGFVTDQLLPLTAVFLTDATPQAPAPATLDFSSQGLGQNFLTLSPAIDQVFFVGDGQTDSGQSQTFYVPSGATRLFLGFPDAVDSQGPPGSYGDNEGSLQVDVTVVPEPCVQELAVLGLAVFGFFLRREPRWD